MQVCPSCARIYEDGTAVCPQDGVFLKTADDPRTGLQVGNYLFKGRLGRGGMGSVYRGEHVVIAKEVAIKVLHRRLADEPQIIDRFLIEARAASMIRHPNIVDVTDFGELPDGSPFFVMEFLDGPDLGREISRQGQLPLYRAVNILTQVARALHACHRLDVVHRDLKPENILLLRREGQRDLVELPALQGAPLQVRKEGTWDLVKILDFGVARMHQMTAALDRETQERGIVFGSPYYVSPEQARGEPGDFRSDLYALGVIFFEMLTGCVPFDGETPEEILRMHNLQPVPSLSATRPDLDLPEEAEQLVARAMAKHPQERHRSAKEFLDELARCFGDVIYGRDINRFLQVRRTRRPTQAFGTPAPSSAQPHPCAAPGPGVHKELDGLFRDKYETQKPVTEGTLRAIRRAERPAVAPRPDPEAVREELAGLFDPEDDS